MNVFPIITKKKQQLYEKIYLSHENLQNNIPCICGYYGRACRNMNNKADSMLCNGCTLSLFVSTVEAILKCCNEKEKIGVEHLFDSDIYDIQAKLKEKTIKADFSYIESVLEYLIEDQKYISGTDYQRLLIVMVLKQVVYCLITNCAECCFPNNRFLLALFIQEGIYLCFDNMLLFFLSQNLAKNIFPVKRDGANTIYQPNY